MLTAVFTGSFKKDRKLMVKQNKNMDKLNEVMDLLINEKPLLPKHENHPLPDTTNAAHRTAFVC